MEWFTEFIAKINKRAKKLGQKEITYNTVSEQFIEVEQKVEVEEGRYKSHNHMTLMVPKTIPSLIPHLVPIAG
jgi:hypothetical protein